MPKFKFPKYTIARVAWLDGGDYPELYHEISSRFDTDTDLNGNQTVNVDSEKLADYIRDAEGMNIQKTVNILKPVLDAMERQNIDQLHIYKG